MKRFYRENEVAEILGISPRTLANRRCAKKEHPPYKRVLGGILYPVRDFEIWLENLPIRRELVGIGQKQKMGAGY